MAKYAVHTKWSWPDGVPSAERALSDKLDVPLVDP